MLIRLLAPVTAAAASLVILVPGAAATFPGANGKLTFTRTVAGITDVWTMDPDGQSQALIAGGAATYERASSFSADGERIAFTQSLTPATDAIAVMNADGSDATVVTGDASTFADPVFSPDGRTIVYQTLNQDIAAIEADGQNRRLLTSGSPGDFEPAFSPDGRTIIFTRSDGTGINIWRMDPDGQNQAPLIAGPNDQSAASFSPDGARISFVQSPPGDNPGDVWVADSASGQDRQQLTSTPTVHDGGPVFSPDGQRIAFSQAPSGGGMDGEIVVMDANGQNQAAVTQNGDFDNQVDWQALNPPACILTGDAKTKSSTEVSVALLCSNENAAASAGGELTAKAPKKRGAAESRKKIVQLTPASAQVPQGSATALTLAIPKKGRRALKRSGKAGTATVTVTVTDDLGASATLTHTVKVKPKRKRK